MFRLDLQDDVEDKKEVKTPNATPVPEGFSYDPNTPWSSLINWDEEEKKLAQEKEKKQSANQRIMRTNAIGDAFRLLIDAVGGAKGARIVPRPTNPGIVKAVETYWGADEEYRKQIQDLSTRKLAARSADLQYKLGLEQTNAAQKFQADESKKERTARKELVGDQKIAELEVLKARGEQEATIMRIQAELTGNLEKIKAAESIEEQNNELENQLVLEKAKAYNQRGMFGDAQKMHPIFIPPKSETLRKEQEFIVDDLPEKPTIYLSQGLMDDLRSELQSGKSAYDDIPSVLKDAIRNERIEYSSLKTVFKENWQYLKKLLPPKTYEAIYGNPQTQQAAQTSQGTAAAADILGSVAEYILSTDDKAKVKRQKIIDQARKYMPGYTQAEYEQYADGLLK